MLMVDPQDPIYHNPRLTQVAASSNGLVKGEKLVSEQKTCMARQILFILPLLGRRTVTEETAALAQIRNTGPAKPQSLV